ncbi:MAG TPA: phospho-N-acetylmuramoyl-pentapeptide-transferase, partial [Planctomycetota bacterium]|nr:phospho-N-acetylmuramoyl-pentapeptide-transferase [Planctomycetota bacterium]
VLVCGRRFIRLLRQKQVLEHTRRGDSERLDLLHATKGNTPTMGGLVMFGAVLISTLLWARLEAPAVPVLLLSAIGLAGLGFADDLMKLRRKKGISARVKLGAQLGISLLAGAYLYADPLTVRHLALDGDGATRLFLPFLHGVSFELGLGFILLVAFVTTGASNSVNLTDGLDGLATGCSLLVGSVLVAVAFASGDASTSAGLHLPHIPQALEAAVFLSALLGSGLGFLWFNCHPAEIFMGDTGALPLGGSLGLAAVILKQELLLVLVGGVLVAEALSVILQVLSFKIRRKRIFLIAPLHHHFQFKGWSETKITVRFWIAGAILALVSVAALHTSRGWLP